MYFYDGFERSQTLYFSNRGDGSASWGKIGYESDHSILVTTRSSNWHGVSLNIKDSDANGGFNVIGKELYVSYWAYQESGADTTISATLQVNKPDGGSDWPADTRSSGTVPSGVWTFIEGYIAIPSDITEPLLYWEETNTIDFYIDNVTVAYMTDSTVGPRYEPVVAVDAFEYDFNDGSNDLTGRAGSEVLEIIDSTHDGKALSVSGRTATWNGVQLTLAASVYAGKSVEVSFYVLHNEATPISLKSSLEQSIGGSSTYTNIGINSAVPAGEWTYITGTITIDASTTKAVISFESEDSATAGYILDDVQILFDGAEGTLGGAPTENTSSADASQYSLTTGANEAAGAAFEAGSVVFYNSFENALGNYLDGANSFNYAVNSNATDEAKVGSESVYVSSREYDSAGCGLRLSSTNSVPASQLVGKKVEFSVWVMYKDSEYVTMPDTVDFVIWNRQNKINAAAETQEDMYEKALIQTVAKGEWVHLVAELTIVDGIDNGMLLIGTTGETKNPIYLTPYYMDEMMLKIIE